MEVDDDMAIELRGKQADQQRCPPAGDNELALGLTSRLKIASRSSENFKKANTAQAIGAAVLTGGLALALYLFKKRKPPSNKRTHDLPPASPQVNCCRTFMQVSEIMYSVTSAAELCLERRLPLHGTGRASKRSTKLTMTAVALAAIT